MKGRGGGHDNNYLIRRSRGGYVGKESGSGRLDRGETGGECISQR